MHPRRFKLGAVAGFAIFCTPAYTQTYLNLMSGPMEVNPSFHIDRSHKRATASAAATAPVDQSAGSQRHPPFHIGYYESLDSKRIPVYAIGTDPADGAATTIVPVVLVPLKFVFPNDGPTLDGTDVIQPIVDSPIFQKTSFTSGPVDLGVTQYGDALLRAQYWNLPGFSRDYHVLLGTPSIAPTVTVNLTPAVGTAFQLSNGGNVGFVDDTYLADSVLAPLLPAYPPDVLPIFVTHDVFTTFGALGYHDSQPVAAPAQSWIFTSWGESDVFLDPTFADVSTLSHEIAEWLNDPFAASFPALGTNFIPPAELFPSCQAFLEVGDPLSNWHFTKTIGSTSYTLQDEVNPWWYLHSQPSPAANGWYTFQNLSAVVPLVVNSPHGIAGQYTDTATFPWAPIKAKVNGNVVYVGRGCPAGSINGTNPDEPYLADPNGAIALIDRGSCNVSLKVDRATKAGATAVLIGMVKPGHTTSVFEGGGTQFAPSLMITQDTSNLIKAALGGGVVNVTLDRTQAIPAPFSFLCGPG